MIFWILILLFIVSMGILDEKVVKEYSPLFSFCKELNRKMEHFPDKGATWLKIYMNLVLPGFLLLGIFRAWNAYQAFPIVSYQFAIAAIFAAIMLVNCLAFREIDRFAYYFNIIASVSILALLIYENIDIIGFALFSIVFWFACIIVNLSYFHKKKELFLLSKKELAEKYTYI